MKACRIEEYLPLDEELEMADETKFMICSAYHSYVDLKIRIYKLLCLFVNSFLSQDKRVC